MTARSRAQATGYLFLAPYFALFIVFIFIPVVASMWLAFVQLDLANTGASKFVGFQNFADVYKDDLFWKACLATGKFAVLMVPSTIIIGTALGIGMHNMARGQQMARALVYLPAMLNVAATGILWQWFFSSGFGLFNYLIKKWGGQDVPWLTDAHYAMPSVAVMSLWWTVGGTGVVVLTALQQIPKAYLEAAALDGASDGTIFRKVLVPLLTPVLLFVFVTTTITSFQMFGQAMVLTGGGPTFETRGLVQYMFESAFQGFRFGFGAAVSWALFLGILVFSIAQTRLLKPGVEQ